MNRRGFFALVAALFAPKPKMSADTIGPALDPETFKQFLLLCARMDFEAARVMAADEGKAFQVGQTFQIRKPARFIKGEIHA